MNKVMIIGNPNVGKSTLFNSLTRSREHTGNFHGVTVKEKSKIISFENEKFEIVDLPGLYSLNSMSQEEEVSKNYILNHSGTKLVIADANSLRKNLYLCLQLSELGIDYKILINNYDYFLKKGNKLNILELKKFNFNIEIKNAKKEKNLKKLININKNDIILPYLKGIFDKIQKKFSNLEKNEIINAINGIYNNLTEEEIIFIKSIYPEIIKERYNFIDCILKNSLVLKENYVYGLSKFDKFFLNPTVMIVGFLAVFFCSIYLIFFLIGAQLSDLLILLNEKLIIQNFMNIVYAITDNVWIIEFFSNGVFSSISTVLTFLPQVALLFAFLTILEDSGIIARMSYVFDDFLSIFGLNGKAIYTMLLGLGCNTMSTHATRNLSGKNLKIKTALINPYLSCMARLPVFVLVASAFFGSKAYWIVAGLYTLGFIVALLTSLILNKTILKSKTSNLLLEFPPLRFFDFKHTISTGYDNAKDMFKRIFSTVLSVGVIVWCLSHTKFNLSYTENFSNSILFFFADKIAFLFKPIGLGSAGVVSALISGILAKELIVSTMSVVNNTQTTQKLMASLLIPTSVISFNVPSAVSFLIFVLLYCPCASNIAVLKSELGGFWALFSVVLQITTAYMLSFVVYLFLTKGFYKTIIVCLIIGTITFALLKLIKIVKNKKSCHKCSCCSKKWNSYFN